MQCFFFFNNTATTEIYTLSLHDALPISSCSSTTASSAPATSAKVTDELADAPFWPLRSVPKVSTSFSAPPPARPARNRDRKSTRLNSSHANISYAVFCLKKKKTQTPLYN